MAKSADECAHIALCKTQDPDACDPDARCSMLHMNASNIDWDRVHRSNFEAAAFRDINWISKARGLYESARKLEPEVVRLWESYLALMRAPRANMTCCTYP